MIGKSRFKNLVNELIEDRQKQDGKSIAEDAISENKPKAKIESNRKLLLKKKLLNC